MYTLLERERRQIRKEGNECAVRKVKDGRRRGMYKL